MQKFFYILTFTILLFSSIISAQEKSDQEKKEYKYALQFQIGPNFTLEPFLGAVFSGKYNFDKYNSLRLGISINNRDSESNDLQNDPNAPFTSLTNEYSYTYFTLNFQYLRNNYWDDFNFYFGGGPSISYGFQEDKNSSDSIYSNNSQKTNGFGVTILSGVEWFFNERMSLSAEYGLSFKYERRTENYSTNNIAYVTRERKIKNFFIYGNGVLFGISVYF